MSTEVKQLRSAPAGRAGRPQGARSGAPSTPAAAKADKSYNRTLHFGSIKPLPQPSFSTNEARQIASAGSADLVYELLSTDSSTEATRAAFYRLSELRVPSDSARFLQFVRTRCQPAAATAFAPTPLVAGWSLIHIAQLCPRDEFASAVIAAALPHVPAMSPAMLLRLVDAALTLQAPRSLEQSSSLLSAIAAAGAQQMSRFAPDYSTWALLALPVRFAERNLFDEALFAAAGHFLLRLDPSKLHLAPIVRTELLAAFNDQRFAHLPLLHASLRQLQERWGRTHTSWADNFELLQQCARGVVFAVGRAQDDAACASASTPAAASLPVAGSGASPGAASAESKQRKPTGGASSQPQQPSLADSVALLEWFGGPQSVAAMRSRKSPLSASAVSAAASNSAGGVSSSAAQPGASAADSANKSSSAPPSAATGAAVPDGLHTTGLRGRALCTLVDALCTGGFLRASAVSPVLDAVAAAVRAGRLHNDPKMHAQMLHSLSNLRDPGYAQHLLDALVSPVRLMIVGRQLTGGALSQAFAALTAMDASSDAVNEAVLHALSESGTAAVKAGKAAAESKPAATAGSAGGAKDAAGTSTTASASAAAPAATAGAAKRASSSISALHGCRPRDVARFAASLARTDTSAHPLLLLRALRALSQAAIAQLNDPRARVRSSDLAQLAHGLSALDALRPDVAAAIVRRINSDPLRDLRARDAQTLFRLSWSASSLEGVPPIDLDKLERFRALFAAAGDSPSSSAAASTSAGSASGKAGKPAREKQG